jgi:hypothetical protein
MTAIVPEMKSGPKPPIDTRGSDALLALLAATIGLIVRISAPFQASFPLNDGGLFYRMILDLQANGFVLPIFTTYNASNIPFAYPPLAFYLTGLISSVFRLDVLTLMRVLPALLSTACIPVFYFLGRQIMKAGQGSALAATFAFAFVPRGFEWQIMGGGLTRALGFVFGLLTLYHAHRLFSSRNAAREIFPTFLFGALTVLSHPEATLQTALAVLIFYVFLDRSLKGGLRALATGLAIVIASAPWWATVISQHGLNPFLAAATAARTGTTVDLAARIFLTFQFNFTEEPYLQLIAIFGLIGLFATLARREFLLPVWVIAPLFLEPRSAPQFMVIPLAMLAGIGLIDVVVPGLQRLADLPSKLMSRAVAGFLIFAFVYLLFAAYLVGSKLASSLTLQPSEREALSWVRLNTPRDSRFVLLTGAGPLVDPLAEWFPALTVQKSLDTVFGTEWLANESFAGALSGYEMLQQCLDQNELCLQSWAAESGQGYSYVLIRRQSFDPLLVQSLRRSAAYKLIYESATILIFEKIV